MVNNKRRELQGLFDQWMTNKASRVLIFFYEWSDVSRQPIVFHTVEAFAKFCEDSHIAATEWEMSKLKGMTTAHAACKEGKPELIIRSSKTLVQSSLK